MGRKSQFCTILFYEIKKILTARTTLILFIFIAAYSVIQGKIQANQLDKFDIETRDLQRSIDGRPIDDALIAETAEAAYKLGMPFECWDYSNCTYMNLSHWLKQIADDNSKLTDYNSESIYQTRDSSVSESMNSMKLTENEKEYWQTQEENLSKPIIWHYTEEINGLISTLISLPLILLFMTTLLLSQIFAGEIKDKTDPLIKCTVGGWGDTYLAKVTAAFICTLFLNIVIEAVTVLTSFFLWGKDTWNIPIQLFMPLTAYSMTIGQFIRAQLIMITATCLLMTAVTCFLSEILKSPVAVMSGVFGSFLIVYISSNRIPYSSRMLSQLFCLLSPMYMTSGSALREYRLIGGSGHYLTALQFAPVLYIAISITLITSGYFIYTNKK
ncbi:ABC transporter permease [Butyrivibrio sp. AE2005]|uniref:ABC transporter permease n=1 Tax=Butyrivibrio sp. AE2005 TaxID=1496722 RepID=UPI00047DB82C|nr:ABC transporter permease [Butyrivibrio sp. AE2005]